MPLPDDARIILIVNPRAGAGRAAAIAEKLQAEAVRMGYASILAITTGPGHASDLAARAAAQGAHAALAIGGDGTVHEVGRALVGTGTALGIIPMGSGNGLARHLGLPLEPRLAVQALPRLHFAAADVGYVNGRPFFVSFGIGFDAAVAHAFANAPTRGLPQYAKSTWDELKRAKAFSADVTADGTSLPQAAYHFISVANADQFGNNAIIAPNAGVFTRKLSLVRFTARHIGDTIDPLQAAGTLPLLFAGKFNLAPNVQIQPFTELEVGTEHPVLFHVDGEPCGAASHWYVQVAPGRLRVLTATLPM